MDLQKKVDERVALIKNAEAFLNDRDNGLTAEDSATFDQMMSDADALKSEIDSGVKEQEAKAERFARIEAEKTNLEEIRSSGKLDRLIAQGGNAARELIDSPQAISNVDAVNAALEGFAAHGHPRLMDDQQQAAAKQAGITFGTEGATPSLTIPLSARAPKSLDQLRAGQTVGTNSEGGYTVPEGFSNALEKALLTWGPMREVADVIRTDSGNDIQWPTVNDTSNTGSLITELASESDADTTFSVFQLGSYKYTSGLVRVSVELMSDSAFSMGTTLGDLLGERIARIQNNHATVGTGSSQPQGVTVGAAAGISAAGTDALTTDELISAYHSVGRAYRQNATWMANDDTIQAIRKLKDSDNNYLWQPGLVAGQPDILLGRRILTNDDMPAMTTGNVPVVFGDMSAYKLRESMGVTLIRLNERYADQHAVAFVAISRFDGGVLDAGTGPIKKITMA